MPQMKSFFDLVNELSMKSDKKLPNLKVPVKGKKGVSKFSRKKAIGQAKDDLNAGFKTDANRKAAFAKMNDAVQSADRKPEKYLKPDGKVGIRMVKTDKEVIKKEQMQVFRIGHKTMGGNVHAKDSQSAMAQLRKKGVKGDIKLTHRGSVKSMPKAKKVEQTEASVLKPTKPTDIIKHAKTLAKNPRDYMMNKKKYLDKARAKVFRMYPKEAINHDDAHRDAQTHSDGSMSVKKIPSMIKKPGDKHLHLHMKSYHKEKDGQDFAKKHGYKVKNYVKTPSGTRMDIHKEMVDPMDLRGRPKKPDPNPESPYGIKHPLHPANIAKKKAKEAEKVKKEEVDVKEDVTHMTIHNGADGFNSAKKASHKKDYEKKHGVKVSFSGNGVTYSGKKANVTKAARGHFPDHKEDGMPSDIHKWHDGKDISVKKEEVQVDEALNLAQRMKRSRLMKRMKARIKIGRKRAMKKMANKKTIEKRAMRQARNQIAKKLTRGIPKGELTFARKQEIEKRLAKPALQQRIKRMAKRIFKDVRKKEVERKKG